MIHIYYMLQCLPTETQRATVYVVGTRGCKNIKVAMSSLDGCHMADASCARRVCGALIAHFQQPSTDALQGTYFLKPYGHLHPKII